MRCAGSSTHFGGIPPGPAPDAAADASSRSRPASAASTIRKEGTTAYLKVALSRAGRRPTRGFFPLLVLDAVLTGAKGVNLWSSFRVPPPQRSARLYRALVERGLASTCRGALLPTEQPFLYTVSATATDGTSLASVEAALLEELDRVRRDGHHRGGARRGRRRSCSARLVFDNDSVTNIAHQLGYFETIASVDVLHQLPAAHRGGDASTQVADAARRDAAGRRTAPIGWFEPLPVDVGLSGSRPRG